MALIELGKNRQRTTEVFITISPKTGFCTFNAGATRQFNVKDKTYLKVFFDKEKNLICFLPAKDGMKVANQNNNAVISAWGIIREMNIKELHRYFPFHTVIKGVTYICIDLNKKLSK